MIDSTLTQDFGNLRIRRDDGMRLEVLTHLGAIGLRTGCCVFVTPVRRGTVAALTGVIDTSLKVFGQPLPEPDGGATPALRERDQTMLKTQVAAALAGSAPEPYDYLYSGTTDGAEPRIRCLLRAADRDQPLFGAGEPLLVGVAHLQRGGRSTSEEQAVARLFTDVFERWIAAGGGERPAVDESIRVAAEALEIVDAQLRRDVTEVLYDRAAQELRLASDIHDGICQQLGAAAGMLSVLTASRRRPNPDHDKATLAAVRDLVDAAVAVSRHAITELLPPPLDDVALPVALRRLAEVAVPGAVIQFDIDETVRLPELARTHVYRIAGEALTNARKHSGASTVQVRLLNMGHEVQLLVRDDGCGFHPREEASPRSGAFGLLSMKARAVMLGTRLEVITARGSGTEVRLRVRQNAPP